MTSWKCVHINKFLYKYRLRDGWGNTTFTRNKAIQDHLALGRNHYAKEFEEVNRRLLGAAAPVPPPVVTIGVDKPCFVVASRTEEASVQVRERLAGHDVFVKIGAKSIFEAYEEGRLHWKGHRRIIYVHDDVIFNDLPKLLLQVEKLPVGLHGPCGSAAKDARDKACWWDEKPLAGAYVQHFKDGAFPKKVRFQNAVAEVSWLDGFCLIAVDQTWSWKVAGNPAAWHGYDWLACKRTNLVGGKCFTLEQDEPLLGHEGYMRTEGFSGTINLLRVLSRTAEERQDYPNIHEHLPQLEACAKGVILELGSRDGASTTAFLKGVEEKGGHVFSVDIDSSCAKAWEGHPQWTFIAGDSCDIAKVEGTGIPKLLDVLFIDSEHTYERAKKELETWLPRVRPGGLILMHDTESFPGVKKAAQEFIANRKLSAEWKSNCNGLAVIHAPGDVSRVGFVVLEAVPSILTVKCLESIRKWAPGSEIVLVANGCEPLEPSLKLSDKIVRLDINLGFAAGCNRGAMEVTRPLTCFVNNDMTFVDDTPARLVRSMGDQPFIVAPYSNRAKPPQGDVSRELAPMQDAYPPMVVGLCMMLPTELCRALGGFDSRLLTWEDDDFCGRALAWGVKSKVVGGTWVDHERHATFKALGLDVNKVMADNQEIYKKKNPVIRAIVIAKDEEKALAGFFAQLLPITRDWCVLDTGSTDGTVALAKRMGAKVEQASFRDFASARNEALDKFAAGADWIIMFDPDERLDINTISNIKELVFRTPFDIFLAPLKAIYGDGTERMFVPKPFLFRNKPEIRWAFKVHEKLIGSSRQALLVNAVIDHVRALHDDGRREKVEGFYSSLMAQEPYFMDPAYKAKMLEAWPILDYGRTEDQRIRPIHIGSLISVVIPTFKRVELLKRAVTSVLTQDYANVEIVVVGDACPDLWASSLGVDPRIRVLNLKKNYGEGGAVPRNHAIMASAGSLISYLDDDNAWKSDHLSSLYAALRKDHSAFAFSSMEVEEVDLKFIEPSQGNIDTSCVLHEKTLIRKHGWWKNRQEEGYDHDWKFFNRWVVAKERWSATQKPTLIYNVETCGQKEYLRNRARLVSGGKKG